MTESQYSITAHVGAGDKNIDLKHDDRERENHQNRDINIEQSKQNYVQKNYENFQSAYDEIFGDAVDEFNKKQKHKNRKIDNYLKKVKSNKVGYGDHKHEQEPAKQIILAVGTAPERQSENDPQPHLLDTDPKEAEFRKQVLIKYTNEFEKRNPNMVVVNNAIHMDEPNPHTHLTFIPYYHSKRGLSKKYGLNSAIKEVTAKKLGIPKSEIKGNNRELFTNWVEGERSEMARIAKEMKPEFELVRVGSHGYLSPKDFKKFKKRENELKKREYAAKKDKCEMIRTFTPKFKIKYQSKKPISFGDTFDDKDGFSESEEIQKPNGFKAFMKLALDKLNKVYKKSKELYEKRLKAREKKIKQEKAEVAKEKDEVLDLANKSFKVTPTVYKQNWVKAHALGKKHSHRPMSRVPITKSKNKDIERHM